MHLIQKFWVCFFFIKLVEDLRWETEIVLRTTATKEKTKRQMLHCTVDLILYIESLQDCPAC